MKNLELKGKNFNRLLSIVHRTHENIRSKMSLLYLLEDISINLTYYETITAS